MSLTRHTMTNPHKIDVAISQHQFIQQCFRVLFISILVSIMTIPVDSPPVMTVLSNDDETYDLADDLQNIDISAVPPPLDLDLAHSKPPPPSDFKPPGTALLHNVGDLIKTSSDVLKSSLNSLRSPRPTMGKYAPRHQRTAGFGRGGYAPAPPSHTRTTADTPTGLTHHARDCDRFTNPVNEEIIFQRDTPPIPVSTDTPMTVTPSVTTHTLPPVAPPTPPAYTATSY